jgi:hypothetical protein
VHPRPEVVRGGETRLVDAAFAIARPIAETLLLGLDRWYRSGDEPAVKPGALWQAPAAAQLSGGVPSRDSLLAPLQLGRRLLPSPSTPLRLARHLATAGRRAASIAGDLTRPVPEADPPAEPLGSLSGPPPGRERVAL